MHISSLQIRTFVVLLLLLPLLRIEAVIIDISATYFVESGQYGLEYLHWYNGTYEATYDEASGQWGFTFIKPEGQGGNPKNYFWKRVNNTASGNALVNGPVLENGTNYVFRHSFWGGEHVIDTGLTLGDPTPPDLLGGEESEAGEMSPKFKYTVDGPELVNGGTEEEHYIIRLMNEDGSLSHIEDYFLAPGETLDYSASLEHPFSMDILYFNEEGELTNVFSGSALSEEMTQAEADLFGSGSIGSNSSVKSEAQDMSFDNTVASDSPDAVSGDFELTFKNSLDHMNRQQAQRHDETQDLWRRNQMNRTKDTSNLNKNQEARNSRLISAINSSSQENIDAIHGLGDKVSGTNDLLTELRDAQQEERDAREGLVDSNPAMSDMNSQGGSARSDIEQAMTQMAPGQMSISSNNISSDAWEIEFMGHRIDVNPMNHPKLKELAAYVKGVIAWLIVFTYAFYSFNAFGHLAMKMNEAQQAKGNSVVAGTGAQATALIAASSITALILISIVALAATWEPEVLGLSWTSVKNTNPVSASGFSEVIRRSVFLFESFIPLLTLISAAFGYMVYLFFGRVAVVGIQSIVRFIVP